MTVATAAAVISTAESQIGYHEGHSNGHWNNIQKYSPAVPGLEWSQGQAWCATFVSWVAMKAGAANLFPRTASVVAAAAWYRQRGRFSEFPAIGAQVLFGLNGGGTHTGIVAHFDSTRIWTVEGNTNDNGSREGDGVYDKVHLRSDSWIGGYGYPEYPGGIESADPKWAHQNPSNGGKPPQPPAPVPTVSLATAVAIAKHRRPFVATLPSRKAQGLLILAALRAENCTHYSDWQHKMGYSGSDANGIPGKASLTALGNKHGFTVRG